MWKLNLPDRFPELETERMKLVQLAPIHAEAYFALRANPLVMKYILRPLHTTVQNSLGVIAEYAAAYDKYENISWAMCLKDDPTRMIGSIGYYRTDLANCKAEVGYLLHPDHWRKGLVTEALDKVLEYGINDLRLHKIFATYSPENDASRQILAKAGFEKEGLMKAHLYFDGAFFDTEFCGMISPLAQSEK